MEVIHPAGLDALLRWGQYLNHQRVSGVRGSLGLALRLDELRTAHTREVNHSAPLLSLAV